MLTRYRNFTVLVLVIFAQLLLLAYQVKSNQDVRLIRVWAVTAVTPLARVIESVRSGTAGFFSSYVSLHSANTENERLKAELGKLKLENQYLRSELDTADRVRALSAFQARSQSRMVPSRVIGAGTGANSQVRFVDRGSSGGVQRGMAVITPDGIVGKVIAAYPTASQVLLITDPTFAAGVISQKHRVHGTVKGVGHGTCQVDYIQNEETVEVGERFFTSGDDGVFPKGLPVGVVTVVRPGNASTYKQVFLTPSGLQGGLEEVLIVLEGEHQPIPDLPTMATPVHIQPPPPLEPGTEAASPAGLTAGAATEADRMRERYRKLGEAQNHVFGTGTPGSRPPDFNMGLDLGKGKTKPQPQPQPDTAEPPQQQEEEGEAPPPEPPIPAPKPPAESKPAGTPQTKPAQGAPSQTPRPAGPQPAKPAPTQAPRSGGVQPAKPSSAPAQTPRPNAPQSPKPAVVKPQQ